MKTKEQYQAAVDEIQAVCRKHGVFLLGTCETEGILGEITIGDATDPDNSTGWNISGHPIANTSEPDVRFSAVILGDVEIK